MHLSTSSVVLCAQKQQVASRAQSRDYTLSSSLQPAAATRQVALLPCFAKQYRPLLPLLLLLLLQSLRLP
jgi:hypothetical protein